ncbi:MAG: sigma-70 family RNA polymerase sigma factor [Pseudomonadota bacterium]
MDEDSDEALMLAYGKGDAQAFETLYGRYRTALYRYFQRHVGDAVMANDLYQDCWEKVIGARARYDARAPFRAWLFRIAHNLHVDHYRSRKPTEPLPPGLTETEEETTLPPELLADPDRARRFRAAVNALPEAQRDAISLRLDAGLGLEDIARVTGVGPETAKSRLRYATRALKQVLQP